MSYVGLTFQVMLLKTLTNKLMQLTCFKMKFRHSKIMKQTLI